MYFNYIFFFQLCSWQFAIQTAGLELLTLVHMRKTVTAECSIHPSFIKKSRMEDVSCRLKNPFLTQILSLRMCSLEMRPLF
nr:unnamed protein product [Callosobruchus analis]